MSYKIDINSVEDNFKIAIKKWNNGEPYMISMGIDKVETYGYGQLSDFGFWEFPFPESLAKLDIIAAENKLRHDKIRSERTK